MSEESTQLNQSVQELVTELQSLRERSQSIRDREEVLIQQLSRLVIGNSVTHAIPIEPSEEPFEIVTAVPVQSATDQL